MAYEKRDNSGAMFKNRKKEKDTHPDMTGDALVFGKDCYISAWAKKDKFGDTFYSFSFKAKDSVAKPDGEQARPSVGAAKQTNLDDIPF